ASGDCEIKIAGDVDKVKHILQNLIGNAVKFTHKGSVDISVKKRDDVVEICVADTGIGIDSNQLPHIFNEFRQVESGNSRHYEGTGLGLAIAKKYARLLGGDIQVQSEVGQGSNFTLTLPLVCDAENKITTEDDKPGPDQAIAEKPIKPASDKSNELPHRRATGYQTKNMISPQGAGNEPLSANWRIQTILLVEDSEPAVIQIQDFLQSSGYKTLIARYGSEALQIVSHTIPDAIILDLMMPGIDGFEVLRNLRNKERTAYIPVLILTAKQITKEELNFLKRNNVYQLIQKGDIKRKQLLKAIQGMAHAQKPERIKTMPYGQKTESKPKVLVVEDNKDNMTAVKALLSDDYMVFESIDGDEGVRMAGQHLPDLVLMDISLTKMDGIKAFKAIRNSEGLEHIPIIALTANALKEEREKLIQYGFDAFLAKPIEAHIFHKTIKEILHEK
ncbi:MAG: response regulator, partial [Bacteroidales bacterium]|nr:response regulator [Bacteroidales bacterium]